MPWKSSALDDSLCSFFFVLLCFFLFFILFFFSFFFSPLLFKQFQVALHTTTTTARTEGSPRTLEVLARRLGWGSSLWLYSPGLSPPALLGSRMTNCLVSAFETIARFKSKPTSLPFIWIFFSFFYCWMAHFEKTPARRGNKKNQLPFSSSSPPTPPIL